eukprot:snap_masked-scaffold_56-processed-gene-0.34-mRNA-1 protein AED:1.00 eAED:1.00 QI:0/0/0/0/1/1/2/0/213
MSYFHKIPKKEVLREEAIAKANKYFEQNELSISSLSLLTIILPSKKPFQGFPGQNPCSLKCLAGKDKCIIRCRKRDFFGLAKIFACFNFGLLYDNQLKLTVYDRLDLVRAVYLVYEEGIFVYRRKLNKVKCLLLCFCAEYFDHEDSAYIPPAEEIIFVKWKNAQIFLFDNDLENFDSEMFVKFNIGDHLIFGRRDVFETIKKHRNKYFSENRV